MTDRTGAALLRPEPPMEVTDASTQKHEQPMHPKYRPDIDGLRAIAVLSVMAYHVAPVYGRGGFTGVDIFFVISGFLISSIIFGNLTRGTWSYRQFYSRRIRRIFPSLMVVLAACFAFAWYALLPDEFAQLSKHVAGGAGFSSNFLLWRESGYFDNSAHTKPLLHLWSLGIEEQFYIVWPLVLTFAWKRRWNLLLVACVIGVASFSLNVFETYTNQVAAFYSPLTRMWELSLGSILAYVTLNHPKMLPSRRPVAANLCSLVGGALIVIGILGITRSAAFPGWLALLPTVGAALIIAAGSNAWLNRFVLANPLAVGIGLISYPLYLWHWPLLSFGKIVEDVASPALRLTLAGAAFPLAWLTYQIVEKPIRFGSRASAKVKALLASAAALAIMGGAVWYDHGVPSRPSIQSSTFTSQVETQFTGPLWKYTDNPECHKRFPFEEANGYPWWFCMLSKDASPTLVLLGNSYANHLYPGLASNPELRQHTILSIGVCGPHWVEYPMKYYFASDPCSGARQLHQMTFINNLIRRSGTVRFAILEGLPAKLPAPYIPALKKRIDFLTAQNVRVIIFLPHVTPAYDTRNCFSRPLRAKTRDCAVNSKSHDEIVRNYALLAKEFFSGDNKVFFFDQNETYCDRVKCSFLKNGLPIFRDEYHHYSEFGSSLMAARFVEWARQNLPDILAAP
ncbi:MAG TPA: acyltransferase family protein [Gemmatimonadaceae bacterium]|nr:acyltransferase family protein [Gemmatimonadaceae bacterium]